MIWPDDLEGKLLDRLEQLPLEDCWTVRPHAARAVHVRSSLYVEDELHLLGSDGKTWPSGLSGSDVGARAGHRITIIHLAARNSGRERPVLLFNHDTGQSVILTGNFAPLLRSRFELPALLAGLAAALALVMAGMEVLPVLAPLDLGRLAMPLFGSAGTMVPVAIVFTSNRRARLRRHLEMLCQEMIALLRSKGCVPAGPLSVSEPAGD